MDNRTKLEIAGVAVGLFGILFDVNGMIFPDEPIVIEKEIPIYIDKPVIHEVKTKVPVEVTKINTTGLKVEYAGTRNSVIWWYKDSVYINVTEIENHCIKHEDPGKPNSSFMPTTFYQCKEFDKDHGHIMYIEKENKYMEQYYELLDKYHRLQGFYN